MASFLSSGKDKTESTPGTEKKPSVNVFEAGSLEEAVAKAREMAEQLGMPAAEIEKIAEKLEAAIGQANEKKFGIYNHASLAGLNTSAEADARLTEINEKAKADPEATVQLKLRDALAAVSMFRNGYTGAQKSGSTELVRVAETGILMMMWAVGLSKLPPEELFKRLATMWTGAGPGELEFRPVFDEDYPAILAAWLDYKEGRIDRKEFNRRCGEVRPISGHDIEGGSETECNCAACILDRSK